MNSAKSYGPGQLVEVIFDFIRTVGKIVRWRFRTILDVVVGLLVLTVIWMLWSSSRSNVVVYVGPPDSASARAGAKVVDELRRTISPGGSNYRARMECTAGSDDIRGRLENSSDDISLGFITDVNIARAGGTRERLSVLLPLDWDYLHVICRTEFLVQHKPKNTREFATDLSEILGYVKPERMFAGTEGSNSAKMAEIVLDQFGFDIESYSARGLSDWKDMRRAFKKGDIDLAFYCGPLGSETIGKIAQDETTALIGLGQITDAIALEYNLAIAPAKFPKNLSRAALTDPANAAGSGKIPFCREGLQTISVRRNLVCPSSLSTSDAFYVARAARNALEHEYSIDFSMLDRPFVTALKTPTAKLVLHPGTVILSKDAQPALWINPGTWPNWLQLIAAGVVAMLVIELLRMGQSKLDQFVPTGSSNTTSQQSEDT